MFVRVRAPPCGGTGSSCPPSAPGCAPHRSNRRDGPGACDAVDYEEHDRVAAWRRARHRSGTRRSSGMTPPTSTGVIAAPSSSSRRLGHVDDLGLPRRQRPLDHGGGGLAAPMRVVLLGGREALVPAGGTTRTGSRGRSRRRTSVWPWCSRPVSSRSTRRRRRRPPRPRPPPRRHRRSRGAGCAGPRRARAVGHDRPGTR